MQLPLAAYVTYQLAGSRPTTGPAELACLAIGCVTGMGAATCCYDVWHMGPDRVSVQQKGQLLYGTYLPFSVIREFYSKQSLSESTL